MLLGMGALNYLTALAVCATLVGCGQRSQSWYATPEVRDEARAAFAQACTDLGECIPESADADEASILVEQADPANPNAGAEYNVTQERLRIRKGCEPWVCRNLMLHEVGHAIGLRHDTSGQSAVMAPSVDVSDQTQALGGYTCADRRQYAALRGLPTPDCT